MSERRLTFIFLSFFLSRSSKLVQLHIYAANFSETVANGNFRSFLKKIEDSPSENKRCFQGMLDEIWVESVNGRHLCRVLEYGVVNPGDWLKYSDEACFSAEECRGLILTLMRGLCELHDQGFAHREINIFSLVFVSAEVDALSDDQLYKLLDDPMPQSVEAIDSSRTSEINLPRAIYSNKNTTNHEELMDFNLQPRLRAVPPLQKIGEIKSEIYQSFIRDRDTAFGFYGAPEKTGSRPNPRVTASEDVWSAACVIYEIVTGSCLFNYDFDRILGPMQHTLGDIPDYLRREWGTRSGDVYFTIPFLRWFPRSRTLSQRIRERLTTVITPSIPLEEADPVFSDEEHALLVDLLTKMLEYDPSKRITIREALDHPWFSFSP